ncbi:uncharacterized protein LOC127096355 [Lathyrus oleraceus]|uniref:uncharacterized protein LOC127096355 n=1 Tax=Pisum sativum TaxID=3888 RepID=UPI0021CE2E33|nr:uncharacterized protein LOC127096355 [Pisum sativum]
MRIKELQSSLEAQELRLTERASEREVEQALKASFVKKVQKQSWSEAKKIHDRYQELEASNSDEKKHQKGREKLDKRMVQCYCCNRFGHFAKDYFEYESESKDDSKSEVESDFEYESESEGYEEESEYEGSEDESESKDDSEAEDESESEDDSKAEDESESKNDFEGESDFDPDSGGDSNSGGDPDYGNILDSEGGHASKGGTCGVPSSDIVLASGGDSEQVQMPQRIIQIPIRFAEFDMLQDTEVDPEGEVVQCVMLIDSELVSVE